LPSDRPLRCVMCSLEGERRDEAAFAAWLAEMAARYDLTGQQSYRVQLNAPREPDRFGCYAVYEFRTKSVTTETASRTAAQR
jgi:hypothetical protein